MRTALWLSCPSLFCLWSSINTDLTAGGFQPVSGDIVNRVSQCLVSHNYESIHSKVGTVRFEYYKFLPLGELVKFEFSCARRT